MQQVAAKHKYEYEASIRLKTEGNQLHGAKSYVQAAEKYERALNNVAGVV